MKKFPAFLALVLSLVMLVLPISAMAESTTATVLQVANPAVTIDGETRSMPGLALQLALCESADASIYQLIADVLVNNQNANSAMLQLDSAMNLVGLIGGMTNAYTVNLTEASALVTSEFDAILSQLEPLVASLETWTLPTDIASVVTQHISTFEIIDNGISTNENGVEMQYIGMSGDLTPAILDVLELIDTDALVLDVAEILMGAADMASLGLAESIGLDENNGLRFEASLGTDETGDIIECTADVIVYSEGADMLGFRVDFNGDASDLSNIDVDLAVSLVDPASGETIEIANADLNVLDNGYTLTGSFGADAETVTLTSSLVLGDAQDDFALSMNAVSAYSEYPTVLDLTFSNVKGDMSGSIVGKLTMTDYGDTATIDLTGSYAVTDTGVALSGTLSASDPYSGATVISLDDLSFDLMNGGFNAAISVDDDYSEPMSLGLSLTAAEPADGALYSGVLALTVNDGYSDIGLTADVHALTAEVDTASFYVDPATAINLIAMTEEQSMAAMEELNTVLSNLGAVIIEAYPTLFE